MVLRNTATNKVIRFRIRTLQPLGYTSIYWKSVAQFTTCLFTFLENCEHSVSLLRFWGFFWNPQSLAAQGFAASYRAFFVSDFECGPFTTWVLLHTLNALPQVLEARRKASDIHPVMSFRSLFHIAPYSIQRVCGQILRRFLILTYCFLFRKEFCCILMENLLGSITQKGEAHGHTVL